MFSNSLYASQVMSTPASKRRRLDSASSALHKPFRTPLKKPAALDAPSWTTADGTSSSSGNATTTTRIKSSGSDAEREPKDTCLEGVRGCVNHNHICTGNNSERNFPETSATSIPQSTSTSSLSPTTPSAAASSTLHDQSPPASSHRRRCHVASLPYADIRKLGSDPDIAAAQKEQRALEQRLRRVRADVDVLEQALRITRQRQRQGQKQKPKQKQKQQAKEKLEEQQQKRHLENEESENGAHVAKTGDIRLESLIAKWRSATRRAAEEVYEGAQERVNRMGGVAAWKEREREKLEQQQSNNWGWDTAGSAKQGSDDNDDEEDDEKHDVATRVGDLAEEWQYDEKVKEEELEERALQEAAAGVDTDVSTKGFLPFILEG